jgi:hypothetical protein
MSKRSTLLKRIDFVGRVVITAVVLAGLAYDEIRWAWGKLPKRAKRVKPAPFIEEEREPETVDELVNTVSTAGPVTVILIDDDEPRVWN